MYYGRAGVVKMCIRALGIMGDDYTEDDRETIKDIIKNSTPPNGEIGLNVLRNAVCEVNKQDMESYVEYYTDILKDMGVSVVSSGAYVDEYEDMCEYLYSDSDGTGEEAEGNSEITDGSSDESVDEVELDQESESSHIEYADTEENTDDSTEELEEYRERTESSPVKYIEKAKSETVEETKYPWDNEDFKDDFKGSFEDNVFGYSLEDCKKLLELKKALLITGVPGTGKTSIMKGIITNLTNGDRSKYKIISFSESTDYTSFVGGLTCENGVWKYNDGSLTEICKRAYSDKENKYYLGIDEMSRGNTEAIFGELLTAIEHRGTKISIGNNRSLVVPSNLYIIGTMNTMDNSTKRLDEATFERFVHYCAEPMWGEEYTKWLCDKNNVGDDVRLVISELSNIMSVVNDEIKADRLLGKDKVIGTRAISGIELTPDNIKIAIENRLVPSLETREKRSNNSVIKDSIKKVRELL